MKAMMGITLEEFKARREAIYQTMPPLTVAVLRSAEQKMRNADVEYRFRQQSDFYYLSGLCESEAIVVLSKDQDGTTEFIVFSKNAKPSEVIWTGPRLGTQGAREQLGANKGYDILEQDTIMPMLLAGKQLIDVTKDIHELRLKKSPAECALMRQAALISAEAHVRVIKACKPGVMEYVLEAEFMHEVYTRGCRAVAYSSIVGGGVKACTLHYVDNDQPLRDGDLVLVDAGGEYQYYAADITRTFPVNGRFTEDQKALYNVVLKAQLAAIEMIAPGLTWQSLQKTIVAILVPELVALGILKGEVDTLIKEKAYDAVYMHGSGHWLGLDVHDVGEYTINNVSRQLEPGMVLTVEPGIYIAPNNPTIDKRWWGMGIRIEDDILVTETGHEVLSAAVPKTTEEIEALMKG